MTRRRSKSHEPFRQSSENLPDKLILACNSLEQKSHIQEQDFINKAQFTTRILQIVIVIAFFLDCMITFDTYIEMPIQLYYSIFAVNVIVSGFGIILPESKKIFCYPEHIYRRIMAISAREKDVAITSKNFEQELSISTKYYLRNSLILIENLDKQLDYVPFIYAK